MNLGGGNAMLLTANAIDAIFGLCYTSPYELKFLA